ncbi:MAG TPA: hypothetical protein VE571_01265, partial [Solirubrobacteraceae bacterium]|nr:hypothetical protein [Solirubrobacteraceae bacterium]
MPVRDSVRQVVRRGARHFDTDLSRYLMLKPHLADVIPDHVERLDPEDYVPAPVTIGTGVDLRESDQLALLTSWEGRFESLFASLRNDP